MRNLYLLEKAPERLIDRARARRVCRVAVNVACRCAVVLGGIGFVASAGALDQGWSVLRWMVLELLMVGIMAAGLIGEAATHVELPLDGGADDA